MSCGGGSSDDGTGVSEVVVVVLEVVLVGLKW